MLWLTPVLPQLVAGKQKPGLVRAGKIRDSPCRAGQDSLCEAQREVPGGHQWFTASRAGTDKWLKGLSPC